MKIVKEKEQEIKLSNPNNLLQIEELKNIEDKKIIQDKNITKKNDKQNEPQEFIYEISFEDKLKKIKKLQEEFQDSSKNIYLDKVKNTMKLSTYYSDLNKYIQDKNYKFVIN